MLKYCGECGNVRSSSDCCGGVYVSCNVLVQTSQKNTPVGIDREYLKLEQMNKDNDCKYYRKKRWWQLLWANTNG